MRRSIRFVGVLLCAALLPSSALAAQAEPGSPVAQSMSSIMEFAGHYDAALTIEPTSCAFQEVGGDYRGIIRADAGRGELILHLEELNSLFAAPVAVVVDEPSITYEGPTLIRIGPIQGSVNGRLDGQFGPDRTSFSASYQLGTQLCMIRGSIAGTRTAAPVETTPSIMDLAGYYDATLTIDPASCAFQEVGGDYRGAIRAE